MVGDFKNKSNRGIIPRTFNYLYNEIIKLNKNNNNSENNSDGNNSEENKNKYNIYLSFIQIYLESIQDLLDIDSKEVRIREDPEKGVYLEGVQWVKCNSPEECNEIFHAGERNRNTESTKMNAHSSRSHAILILRIENSIKVNVKTKVKNIKEATDRIITCSYLYLVDLAGSERIKKTGATDMRLEEAKKINVSLLALGNVISALSDNKSNHISYRDSKLTRLLQESLGGNAKTSLIVTVSPSDYNREETISSLFFASRAMKVENKPKVNKSVDYQALCIKLQYDLDKLNDEYAKLKIEYDKVVNELDKIKKGELYLKTQKKLGIDYIDNNNSESNDNTIIENNDNENISTSNSLPHTERDKRKYNDEESTNQEIKKITNNYKNQIKKLEKFYENIMKAKSEEYENFLKKVDNILYDKETEIDKLTEDIKNLNNTIKQQKYDIDDISKERDDLQKSVFDLTTQVQEQKELLENDKTEKEYKNIIDQLNNTILSLEKKIESYEEKNIFSNNINNNIAKDKINNFIKNKINLYQNEINNFIQKKNNIAVKKSQNDIKLKLSKDEAIKNKKIKDKLFNDILNMQKDNYKYISEEESFNNNIEVLETQINFFKNFSTDTAINEYINANNNKNESNNIYDLIILNIIDEMEKKLLNKKIEKIENIFMKTREKNLAKNFVLFKGENDLNAVIKKTSILTNIYENHILKLDDINKEMDVIVNEEEINFSKLNNMRDDIEALLAQSEEINNIIKNNIDKNRTIVNIDNIPIEKCSEYLDKLINIISNKFTTLIESYNIMNYNVCQLLSIIEESNCYKKKFISNLCSIIQENINDNFIKQNTLYKLTNLLTNENNMNNSQKFTNSLEELIKELFLKIFEGINEKDNEISTLNSRIDSYVKQIDMNIKRTNFSRCYNKGFINFQKNNSNNNKTTDDDGDTDKNLLNLLENKITEIKNENKKVYNTYLKDKNVVNNKILIGIIDNNFKQINSIWDIISNQKMNRGNNINDYYTNISRSSNNLNVNINLKDIKGKTLFKQYFKNLSKFSKSIVDYSINNDDDI